MFKKKKKKKGKRWWQVLLSMSHFTSSAYGHLLILSWVFCLHLYRLDVLLQVHHSVHYISLFRLTVESQIQQFRGQGRWVGLPFKTPTLFPAMHFLCGVSAYHKDTTDQSQGTKASSLETSFALCWWEGQVFFQRVSRWFFGDRGRQAI